MRRRREHALLIAALLSAGSALLLASAGCGGTAEQAVMSADQTVGQAGGLETQEAAASGSASGLESTTTAEQPASTFRKPLTALYDDFDLDATWNQAGASLITLADGAVRFDGAGAVVEGNKVTVTAAGTYVVTGKATDAQVIVDLEEKGLVRLVLSGMDLTCTDSAPIYVKRADRTVIVLAAGTENFVTDGSSYVLDDGEAGEPDAAIFSKDDLTINGNGSLVVRANYKNGILSKDQLKIVSGDITVEAVNDAVRGRDCVAVSNATLTLSAGADGIQSTNDEDAAKGFVDIQGGALHITAGADGIQAETTLRVADAEVVVTAGGGSTFAPNQAAASSFAAPTAAEMNDAATSAIFAASAASSSAKGLKAAGSVFVEGGVIRIDSADDALHAHDAICVSAGDLELTSGDDGLHADATIEITGGSIDVTGSYEGIEAAVITIAGGDIHVTADDDGLNVAGGNDGSAAAGPRGADAFMVNENNRLYIDGGYVAIEAGGDGVDCNGRVFMTGGTVIVHGPTEDMNGALDYLGDFAVSGGFLVAAGSAGMAEAPSDSSSVCSLMINFDQPQAAGTLICVQTEEGGQVLCFAPGKQYQSVVLCSADLVEGTTYKVYLGGSCEGEAVDGLYAAGVYTPGTEYAAVTLSGMVTVLGTAGLRGGGGFPRGQALPGARGAR